jgi:nicotinamide-nucleotide amidase
MKELIAKPVENWKAEVMSVGDEIISGQRLDTNTQWLSRALGDLGITVRYHSSVGDDLSEHIAAIGVAMRRADLLIMSGGLGPTADDLTRQAIAQACGVELEFRDTECLQIQTIFERAGRPMPASNRLQAYFPVGSATIANPEGTAPGIDFQFRRPEAEWVRIIALPGVPAEMKQMWSATVEPRLRSLAPICSMVHHHVIHCFGAGESAIEAMLPNLIQRGRDPCVGITASGATISLRISTRGKTVEDCLEKMQPTIETIRTRLGDLIFGENGETLADVISRDLRRNQWKLGICDFGLSGKIAVALNGCGLDSMFLKILEADGGDLHRWPDLETLANQIRLNHKDLNFSTVIGPLDHDGKENSDQTPTFSIAFSAPNLTLSYQLRYAGHSALREERAVKQVLNHIRLFVQKVN